MINNSAFSGCLGLTRVTFGDGLEEFGEDAFNYCRSFEEIVILDNIVMVIMLGVGESDPQRWARGDGGAGLCKLHINRRDPHPSRHQGYSRHHIQRQHKSNEGKVQ